MHVPILNHKNAWAEEGRSPSQAAVQAEAPVRRIIVSPSQNTPNLAPSSKSSPMDHDVLIVASKLKQYVKDKYDLNTSADVMDALSQEVRRITDRAVDKARAEGRKTLMSRDF